jgi:hypothetical protein
MGRAMSSSPYMRMCARHASDLTIPLNVYAACFRSQSTVECVCEMLQLLYMHVICFLCAIYATCITRAIYATCLRCAFDAACARWHIHATHLRSIPLNHRSLVPGLLQRFSRATHFRCIPEYLPHLRDSLAVVPTKYADARLVAA